MTRKKDTMFTELATQVNYVFQHRSGIKAFGKEIAQLKLPGTTIHFDNKIPALIQDVFNNLGYEQKDGTKPIIAAKRRTENGWHLVINLPPGVSFGKVKNDKDYFQDAVNGWIDMGWQAGKCHMNIQLGELPTMIEYAWNPALYNKMILPIPIGHFRAGLHVLDLAESPHLLIGGTTGFGKTSMIASIIHSVMHRAIVVIIDLKGIDFEYLRDHCIVAITNEEAKQILLALNTEFERRRDILRQHKARKLYRIPDPPPYIVLVIDEMAELDKNNFELVDRLVRLARATSMSVVGASQRTSTNVIPGDTRANFVARACFKVPSPQDCRVIMGEDCGLAADLPSVKGRCIYRFGIDTMELQTMYLSEEHAEELAQQIPGKGGVEIVKPAEHKIKRLAPR